MDAERRGALELKRCSEKGYGLKVWSMPCMLSSVCFSACRTRLPPAPAGTLERGAVPHRRPVRPAAPCPFNSTWCALHRLSGRLGKRNLHALGEGRPPAAAVARPRPCSRRAAGASLWLACFRAPGGRLLGGGLGGDLGVVQSVARRAGGSGAQGRVHVVYWPVYNVVCGTQQPSQLHALAGCRCNPPHSCIEVWVLVVAPMSARAVQGHMMCKEGRCGRAKVGPKCFSSPAYVALLHILMSFSLALFPYAPQPALRPLHVRRRSGGGCAVVPPAAARERQLRPL